MSSSMLAGERRWASARRGGMTVLGKVAVPKPLNLPSQRLENHGLDPNVEIVPKGSLSWGSRSSTSASNPWGFSVVSPNADGSGSPSHLNGRPSSSGGSGTRPSTAGSDRMHEGATSAWGPNSRPSSASGALTSNHTSLASSRPRSAETRPGSSQLSRFAEPVSDNSVAWGSTGTVEKLVLNSKNDSFSLSSGDFPTLGKNPESEDNHPHVRPSSASGRVASPKERALTSQADVKNGTINTWTRDGIQHVEDGIHPSAEKWQGDHQPYLNPNIPPQHFDAWHGPPMNAPAGVWYRGPPGGPPYPPVARGGYPMDPFPYYRPQMHPPALANPQPIPPRGPGPRGHHPKNGDFYRPQMPDAFIRPGMPIRPGFFPGPVPYDGYYGPPMGYNPNEHEIPFMGMPAGPPVFNMYPPQNTSEPGDIHARAGGRSGGKRLVTEHVESGHSDVVRGPYKVLKKRPNEWGLEEEEENLEPIASANAMHVEKVEQQRTASPNNEWGSDRRDEEMYSRRATIVENHSSGSLGLQGCSSDPVVVKSPRGKLKAVDDSWGKKSEIAAPSFQEVLPAAPKDTTLMQKIEILNAKVRASDGGEVAVTEEQKSRVQLVNARTNQSMSEAGSTRVSGDFLSSSQEVGGSTGEITRLTDDNAQAISRRAHHGAHGRVEHNNKGRFNNHDADGWRRKPSSLVSESSGAVPVENVGHTSSSPAHHHHVSEEAAEKSESNVPGKNEGESFTPMLDPTDGQAQRAKMRELAKQRAIQLQKEEEERIKEQRAKALAKLEELNRRTLAGDGSAQKLETPGPDDATQQLDESQKHPDPVIEADQHVGQKMEKPLPSGATQRGPEEFQKHPGSMKDADKHVTLKLEKPLPSGASQRDPKESNKQPTPMMDGGKRVSTSSPRVVAQTSESSISGPGESSVLLKDSHLEAPKNIKHELLVLQSQPLPSKLEIVYTGAEDSKAAPSDVSLRRNKRNKQKVSIQVESTVSDKQKQGLLVESTVNDLQKQSIHVESTDKSTSISSDEPLKGRDTGATGIAPSQVDPASAPRLQNNSNIVTESVVHNRRKNSRSTRNKHKLEEAPSSAASQTPVPKENHPTKTSASVASQLPVPNETHPSKTTATTSQSPVQKESHLANPSSNTASQSLVPKETHVTKISASSTSQSPVPKDTHPAKSSVSGTLQSPVPKEAHPAKTPASTASLSLVSSAKSFASAAAQSLVPKETQPAKVPASTSQSAVPKETFPAKGSPSTASQSSVPNETHKEKAHAESGQTKTSQLELDPSPVLLVTDVKDANLSGSEPTSSLPSEEARTRVNNQLKPQNSRRTPRNPQALRSGDKFHGSESVVWAPVRSQQKLEPEGETNQKDAPDAIPPTAKSNNPVQSSIKSKRAEMERYVPKPVAKELAQQSVALSSSAQTSDEISEREELGSQSVKPEIGNVGSSLEPRNGNHKHSKQARTQGSWRQRGSSEAHVEGSQQGSLSTSNPSKNVQRSMHQHDTSKSDSNFVPDDNKATHDWDPSDGWNMPEEPSAAASVTSVVKDDGGGTAKGRRHPHKSHQSTASSHDLDLDHRNNGSGGEADKNYNQMPVLDIIQTDRVVSSKESRSSHWQPKSQAYLGNSQRGSTSSGGQTDSSEVEKNSPSRGRVQTQLENKESSDITGHPPHEQSVSENKKAGEATNAVHGEARKERRSAASRRRPRTPNQAAGPPDNMEEQAADQHYSTGYRRGGIRNNQSGRGNESQRDWSSGGQDNRPQYIPPSRERQRQNSHFEYQPVGSNSNNGEYNNYDGPVEGSRNVGSRYRERGSGRPRRGAGNFHVQQSGAIRVEAGND